MFIFACPRGIDPFGGILRRRSARRNSIGQAFHGAGAEIGQKGAFFKGLIEVPLGTNKPETSNKKFIP